MVSRISLLLITMLMTALAGAQTIDDDLKKRIDALNKKDGKAQTQLVNNALDRVKEADLETVKTILASDDYKNRLSAYHQTARTVLGLEQETTSGLECFITL